jgi:hypothetical protein
MADHESRMMLVRAIEQAHHNHSVAPVFESNRFASNSPALRA